MPVVAPNIVDLNLQRRDRCTQFIGRIREKPPLALEIRMLGPVVLLEGFITNAADREKAISLAAMIVGYKNVQDRMLSRFPTQ
ncbi:BON domain-containing protein [Rhizobium leguminosarum]|uniref:BON domain-containing protein n=1 Tax=Rhizobium leguminosarum TaxID=384 RepID=UPI0028C3CE84|nr:BON domain-containing protein [Rhizobium leguminosarum]